MISCVFIIFSFVRVLETNNSSKPVDFLSCGHLRFNAISFDAGSDLRGAGGWGGARVKGAG